MTADFIWRMEDVLELYHEPYEPKFPVVCFDEMPYQMLKDVYEEIPMKPGSPRKTDYEYKRRGVCNIFMFFQPLMGWRKVVVRERKTKIDFAECVKMLVDEWFPEAEQIRLVCDNLSTHTPVGLYEHFDAKEARRLIKRLDFRYTPKHGSWLNMAEIELSILSRQCLKQRIPEMEQVQGTCTAWEEQRTHKKLSVDWRFSVEDARVKLERLYPKKNNVSEH